MLLRAIAFCLSIIFILAAIILSFVKEDFGRYLGGNYISGLGFILVLYCITATITRIAMLYSNINSIADMKTELNKLKNASSDLSKHDNN